MPATRRSLSLAAALLLAAPACHGGIPAPRVARARPALSPRSAVRMAGADAPPPPPPPQEEDGPKRARADEDDGDGSARTEQDASVEDGVLGRFMRPRVDDGGLPIADSLVAISAPVLLATVILAGGLPRPSWLVPAAFVPDVRALPFVLPAVGHGITLATCWVLGAFAAAAYTKEAYGAGGSTLQTLAYTARAGAFATGLLILLTQAQLYAEVGPAAIGAWAEPGFPATAADFIIVRRTDELALDVAVEAAAMTSWRLYRASLYGRFGD